MKSQILHTVWCDIKDTEDQWRSFERQLSSIHSHRQKPERSKPQLSDILRRSSTLICLLLVAHFFCHQPNAVTSDSRMSFNIQYRLRLLWQRVDAWNMSHDCLVWRPIDFIRELREGRKTTMAMSVKQLGRGHTRAKEASLTNKYLQPRLHESYLAFMYPRCELCKHSLFV